MRINWGKAPNLNALMATVSLAVVVFLVGCSTIERRVLFCPKPLLEPIAIDSIAAANEDLSVESIFFETKDRKRLHGLLVEPKSTRQQVVLFSHGRNCNVESFQSQLIDFVRRHGVAVFAYDYRGFGLSEGRPDEAGVYQDARAARDWMAARYQMPHEDVVLMGRSLGAAVAVELAANDGANKLVLECPFSSVPEVVEHHMRGVIKGRFVRSKFNSIDKIGQFQGQLFVGHAVRDKTIPMEHGLRLAEAAENATQTTFSEILGEHNSPPDDEYNRLLGQFLKQR